MKVREVHKRTAQINDLCERMAGGFFLANKLEPRFKIGDKFKKNDILAADKQFFSDDGLNGNRFNIGSLQKVACMSSYSTYEDSTFITKKISTDMAADIIMEKAVVLGVNSNVDHMVKVGDSVKVGDQLLSFDISFEDNSLNKFLANIGTELREEIKSLGKTKVSSKYTGTIEDIKIYSTVDPEELSPSLRKIVEDYWAQINKRKKFLDKYDNDGIIQNSSNNSSNPTLKAGLMINEPTSKVQMSKDGKVMGHEVGAGILVRFFIKYRSTMGVGDKVTKRW